MLKLGGNYYPPRAARRVEGWLIARDDGHLVLRCDGTERSFRVREITISPALGGVPRVFQFPDEGKFECEDHPDIGQWLRGQGLHAGSGLVHRLERRWQWVAGSLVVVVAAIVVAIFYGIPASAARISKWVPKAARMEVGNEVEKIADRMMGGDSGLEPAQLEAIQLQFIALSDDYQTDDFPLALKFRDGGALGANALAIPNGTIIVTDEMVDLAADPSAVMGILAHEIGHLHLRHGLQRAIQASSLPLLFALVTGDLASGSSLLGTIPISLVNNGYSRAHEREADEFALDLLTKHQLSTEPVAELFERILMTHGDIPGWLSTHPATVARVEFFREGGKRVRD